MKRRNVENSTFSKSLDEKGIKLWYKECLIWILHSQFEVMSENLCQMKESKVKVSMPLFPKTIKSFFHQANKAFY